MFEIGDRVMAVNNSAGEVFDFLVGKVGVVSWIDNEDEIVVRFYHTEMLFEGNEYIFSPDELALVGERGAE